MQYNKDEIKSILVSHDEIQTRLDELVAQINRDYEGKELLLVCILKGAVTTFADVLRRITIPCEIDFMCISSYGASTKSSGVVRILKDLDHGIEGKDLLIVEDIVDSGRTIAYIKNDMLKKGVKSLKVCALLDKPDRRVTDVRADYCGFVIPDEFVVGYGLDFDQKYRNFPEIGVLKEEVYENGVD